MAFVPDPAPPVVVLLVPQLFSMSVRVPRPPIQQPAPALCFREAAAGRAPGYVL